MSNSSSIVGRWIAAVLALLFLVGAFGNMIIDVMPKGEVRSIKDFSAWQPETLKVAETLPVQDGGRVKPLSTYAGFKMYALHGARSMKVLDKYGKKQTLDPTAWFMETIFRPQMAIKLPTFRVDNSDVLEAIGVKPLGRRDRYSYEEISPARAKLIDLAKSYEAVDKDKRDPMHSQLIALAYNVRDYESMLGYFGFARFGVTLRGTGKEGKPDQRADMSAVMMTAPQIGSQMMQAQAQGGGMEPHLQELLQQVFDAANFAKFGLAILPPSTRTDQVWLTAGNAIYNTFSDPKFNSTLAISDIRKLESVARSVDESEPSFRAELTKLRDDLKARAEARGEYKHIDLEVGFNHMDWFLNAWVLFILGTISAFTMWAIGAGKTGRVLYWVTLGSTATALIMCVVAITQRCIIMDRPPVGNLYDTIIFIATTVGIISLAVEGLTRKTFALGLAPIMGAMLIALARRFEVGDAKDNMDPLVAVLNSNYWLTIHVLTITLGYAAGLLSAFLSFLYLLARGLKLIDNDRDMRRALTKAVYGMICLTLFLALIGTVLGGVWANDSWGRFWGWDPKENGALMIVLWTLAILHARLGGYLREWGLHLAGVFTAAVVTFSWWHVNFLGVGLHNYGFTAGKETIWTFYKVVLGILVFGAICWGVEVSSRQKPMPRGPRPDPQPPKLPESEGIY